MIMRDLIALAFVAAIATPATARTIDGAYVGCVSKETLDEFITAAVNNDNRQMQALIGTVCVPINGLEYSIVDRGFLKSQIRVYNGSNSAVVWTVSEAVR
jgi:hypothetical protein